MGTLWFRSINWWRNSIVWSWPSLLRELSVKWSWFCQYQVSVIVGKRIHSRTASDLIIFCFSQVYHVTVVCRWEVLLCLYPTCLWCKLQGRSCAALCRLHAYTFFFHFLCVCNFFISASSHWSVLHKSCQVSDLPVFHLWKKCSFMSEF